MSGLCLLEYNYRLVCTKLIIIYWGIFAKKDKVLISSVLTSLKVFKILSYVVGPFSFQDLHPSFVLFFFVDLLSSNIAWS